MTGAFCLKRTGGSSGPRWMPPVAAHGEKRPGRQNVWGTPWHWPWSAGGCCGAGMSAYRSPISWRSRTLTETGRA